VGRGGSRGGHWARSGRITGVWRARNGRAISAQQAWCAQPPRQQPRDGGASLTAAQRGRGRGPALGGPGCCNFAFSTTRAPVRLFLPSKLSHPLIYEWVGPNRGAEGVKHTLSSLGSAPQAQEGPTPRPRMRPRCSHSEADRTACSQAVRPAVAFACGIRSSRWLRCFSQSPVARGRRAR